MDIEKLKKLVKLANNNPNENEANLAARKVCQILEQTNFQAIAVVNKQAPPQQPKAGPYEDFLRNYARKPPKQSSFRDEWIHDPATHTYWNPGRGMRISETEYEFTYSSRAQAEQRRREKEFRKGYWAGVDFDEPRVLQCKVCGKHKETLFVGHPSQFTCSSCAGTEWK